MDNAQKLTALVGLLEKATNILVTSHISPDLDAIGSSIGAVGFVKAKFPDKNVKLVLTGDKTQKFDFVPNIDWVEWAPDISDSLKWADTFWFLDGNSLGRFLDSEDRTLLESKVTICLDHHPNTPDQYDLDISDYSAASASQVVADVLFEDKKLLTKNVAEAMLLGIIADTGSFKFINQKRSDSLRIAKELIDFAETDVQALTMQMSRISKADFELVAKMLANTVTVDLQNAPGFTYSYLDQDDVEKYGLETVKTAAEKFKGSFLRQLEGYPWGFVVTPDSKTEFGLSFRSTPFAVNVKLIAEHFNGGGHLLAAGGSYPVGENPISAKEVAEKVVEFIQSTNLEIVQS